MMSEPGLRAYPSSGDTLGLPVLQRLQSPGVDNSLKRQISFVRGFRVLGPSMDYLICLIIQEGYVSTVA